jgi:ribosomal protein S18 acetylase RimI-like enzyme
MKRLYVSPEARGFGLGERLVYAVMKEAERIGYREMRLDTLPSMAGAIALYRKLGFEPIEPYYDTPVIGTTFMRRSLGVFAAVHVTGGRPCRWCSIVAGKPSHP